MEEIINQIGDTIMEMICLATMLRETRPDKSEELERAIDKLIDWEINLKGREEND